MSTTLLLNLSGATYAPYRTSEAAVVFPNIQKSSFSCPDHICVPFIISNHSDNSLLSAASRWSFPSYLWYILLWHIFTALTIPPICFYEALPMLPHVFLPISLSTRLLIYFPFLILPFATSSFNMRAKNLALQKYASGFSILNSNVHFLYALLASVNALFRGHCMPHTVSQHFIIVPLIHTPCDIWLLNYVHTSYFSIIWLLKRSRLLPSSFSYISFLCISCIYPSYYPIYVAFLWTWEEDGTLPICIASFPCCTMYVTEIMFCTSEDTRVWGLSSHIVAFWNLSGPNLIRALLVETDVECPPL